MGHVTIDETPDHSKRPGRAISPEKRSRLELLIDMLDQQGGEPLQSMTPEEFLKALEEHDKLQDEQGSDDC